MRFLNAVVDRSHEDGDIVSPRYGSTQRGDEPRERADDRLRTWKSNEAGRVMPGRLLAESS
jgi:hypothetical protein